MHTTLMPGVNGPDDFITCLFKDPSDWVLHLTTLCHSAASIPAQNLFRTCNTIPVTTKKLFAKFDLFSKFQGHCMGCCNTNRIQISFVPFSVSQP